jgi:hypothetical protein
MCRSVNPSGAWFRINSTGYTHYTRKRETRCKTSSPYRSQLGLDAKFRLQDFLGITNPSSPEFLAVFGKQIGECTLTDTDYDELLPPRFFSEKQLPVVNMLKTPLEENMDAPNMVFFVFSVCDLKPIPEFVPFMKYLRKILVLTFLTPLDRFQFPFMVVMTHRDKLEEGVIQQLLELLREVVDFGEVVFIQNYVESTEEISEDTVRSCKKLIYSALQTYLTQMGSRFGNTIPLSPYQESLFTKFLKSAHSFYSSLCDVIERWEL